MLYYSFNDCFCKQTDFKILQSSFIKTLIDYKTLNSSYPKNIKGILTDREISTLKINDESSLLDLILSLGRDEKNYALSLFKKFPVENFYPDLEYDNILDKNYTITVNDIQYDGINAKINSLHNGFLFSLGIHEDIKKNQLELKELNNKEEPCLIDNLFGNDQNKEYNKSQIEIKINESRKGYDKILTLFKKPIFYNRFKEEYESLSKDTQDRIYDRLDTAINRKLPTSFAADNNLIKDVTPASEKEVKIFELRIFEPVCVRLYFYEENQNVYLASIRKKPAKKSQTADIKNCVSIIKALKRTEK